MSGSVWAIPDAKASSMELQVSENFRQVLSVQGLSVILGMSNPNDNDPTKPVHEPPYPLYTLFA